MHNITDGIAEASKAIILDSNKDINGIGNIGTDKVTTNSINLGGVDITSNATELNKLHNFFNVTFS